MTHYILLTVKPGSPGKIKASNVTPDSVTLTWSAPNDDGGSPVKKYIIEAKDGRTGEWAVVADVPSKVSQKTIQDLEEGVNYMFRISAVNDIGQGRPTNLDKSIRPMRPLGLYNIKLFDNIYMLLLIL